MNRHLIFGRFGTTDNIGIPSADGEQATPLPFVVANRRIEHDITDSLNGLGKLGVYPSEGGVDLLILAAHVQAADTHISRDSESQDGWTRELRLVVPVSNPALWNASIPLLQRLLNFLTGDRWTVGFRARPEGFEQIALPKPTQLIPIPFDCLSLFSGGLDSLIGSIDLLERTNSPLLVSHAGDGTVSHSQQVIYNRLKRQYSRQNFNRLRVWMDFRRWSVSGVKPDKKTRGRSFLFFAAGAFAGSGFPSPFTLHVPENGLIALNVPLDPLRLGAFSTRTTHPFYIARWNELLQMVGIDGRIDNPYWNKTKGEMVQECANPALLAALGPESFSCASPTKGRWKGHVAEHCGFCLPCLIRRASLRGADQTSYTLTDLSAGQLDTTKAEGQQARSFQFAINRVKNNPSLARLLIHKPGPLSDESSTRQEALADVYLRGLAELDALLAGVRTVPS
jgi:hypothetical protein